jgi:predicted branched-subunit amino acid permease
MIYGAAAKGAGLGLFEAMLMSLTVFAGSSQLVFTGLWRDGVNIGALAFTVVLVNLRLLIYGSSLLPFLGRGGSLWVRLLRSYILTDESCAVSLSAFLRPGFGFDKTFFYIGAGAPTWVSWQAAGVLGWATGAMLPQSVPLQMAAPLVFLTLLVSMLKSAKGRLLPKAAAALASGLSVIPLKAAPYNLGLMLAICVGILFGVYAEERARGRGPGKAKGEGP